MTNGNRISYAFLGYFAGAFVGIGTSIFAILLNIHPGFWFFWTMFIFGPAGAFIGWRYALGFEAWGQRHDQNP